MDRSALERKFWTKKLEIAQDNHRRELHRAATGEGARMSLLAAYSRDAEKAHKKLAQPA